MWSIWGQYTKSFLLFLNLSLHFQSTSKQKFADMIFSVTANKISTDALYALDGLKIELFNFEQIETFIIFFDRKKYLENLCEIWQYIIKHKFQSTSQHYLVMITISVSFLIGSCLNVWYIYRCGKRSCTKCMSGDNNSIIIAICYVPVRALHKIDSTSSEEQLRRSKLFNCMHRRTNFVPAKVRVRTVKREKHAVSTASLCKVIFMSLII